MQAARGTSLNHSESPLPEPSDTAATPDSGRPAQRRLWLVLASIAVLAWGADLTTKILAVERLSGRPDVELVGSWFTLHLTRNPGAAFSTGTEFTQLFSLAAIFAVCLVLFLSRKLGSTGWAIGLGFLLAGILGNLTDRIFRDPGPLRGHVVDFLRLPNWPVFNLADVFINVAAGVIILQAFRGMKIDGTRHVDEKA